MYALTVLFLLISGLGLWRPEPFFQSLMETFKQCAK